VSSRALDPARAAIRRAVAGLEDGADLTRQALGARLRALSGQLRAAVETTATGASEGRRPEAADLRGAPTLRDPVAVLRANLTPDSSVMRHAVRAAVLVAGSDLVVRSLGYAHGYWVSLTVLVVLRPDFASTFQRAVMRVLGTVIGLVLATELLHWIPGGRWYDIALITAFYFGVRLAGPGNIGLTAVSLSGLVVVLLAIDGVAPRDTLVDRSVSTAVGGALALVAVLMLPVWERERVPQRLGELLAAYRGYLDALADPGADLPARQRARAASRLARTNAQASIERARVEPVVARAVVDLGESVLANSHRVVHALMTVDTVRRTVRAGIASAGELPELDDLLRAASEALAACETAVRIGSVPRGVPAVRPLQERLHAVLAADPARAGGAETAGALADATDRLANGVDTLAAELRRHLGPAGGHTGATAQQVRSGGDGF
jgi:uncharacterized membrane protein YccC